MEHGLMEYRCKTCKNLYKSYGGLWKHNKNYNGTCGMPKGSVGITKVSIPEIKKYICKFCNKEYNNKTSKYKHQLKCSKSSNNEIKQIEIKFNSEIEKLKDEIKKCNKKKITNSNNNNNHGIINNNITINKIGTENLSLLNNDEIIKIFNKELESILTFIEMINFNERLKENHSFCTTNLESKFLSTYNDETKKIDKDRKKYFIDKLLNTSIEKMELLYHTNQKLFNKSKQNQIQNSIDNIKSLKNFDFNHKLLKEVHNKINLISYNNRDIIQKTWYDPTDPDEDGEGTFQDDLDNNESPQINNILKLNSSSSDNSSSDSE